jgi:hypothetical protein
MTLEQACARFEEACFLAYPEIIRGERLAKVEELWSVNPPEGISWAIWRDQRFPFAKRRTLQQWQRAYEHPEKKGEDKPVDFQETPQYMERCINRTLEFAEGYAKNFVESKKRGFYAALSRRFHRAIDDHDSTPKTSAHLSNTGSHQHGSAGALREVHYSPSSEVSDTLHVSKR